MNGSIPVLVVSGKSLSEAWENAVLECYRKGGDIRTEYDRKDESGQFVDPPSKDCTMVMTVLEPASEPMIHRAFPGGLEDLEEYRQEVIDGIKDHWVRDPNNPDDNRWEYTYHERIFDYSVPGLDETVDQIERVINKLAESPYSRRCQAITWKAWEDMDCYDPPCLQSMWFRILPDDRDVWHLNMNIRFRSRDAYDACFMNCFAFVHVQEMVAAGIAEKAGREVKLGRYTDMSDSFHIYGRRIAHFEEAFLKQVEQRSFEERTWTREFAQTFFEEARPAIAEKIRRTDQTNA